MKSRLSGIAVVLAAALAACAPQQQDKGSAQVSVATNALHAFSGTTTLRVYTRADFTGSDLDIWNWSQDRYFDGNITGNEHLFDSMPVGSYTVCAIATDSEGVQYGPNCVKPVVVTKNIVAAIAIVLQQVGNDGKVTIDSPFITGITLSDGAPHFTEDVTISATVKGDAPLTYAWSFDCGTSSFSTQGATTVLTSTCRATGTVSLTVSNGQIFSTVSFPLTYYPQGADVTIGLNRWPVISGFHVAQAQLKPGQSTFISVFATDDEPLTYAWSATCGTIVSTGTTVSDGNTNNFTAPATAGDCTVKVEVTDGLGGKSTASVVLHVGLGFLTATPFATVCSPPTWACVPTPLASSVMDASGLHLSKPSDVPPNSFYGVGADIIGVAGLVFESASFDTTGIVSVGTPRFVVWFSDGSRCLVDNADRVGNTYTFTNASLYQHCAGPEHGAMTSAEVVADGSNTDPASNTITLTNITVNGIPVIQ